MPIKVNCSMCGANILADDLAIRRGFVTCDHCATLLRITEKGASEFKGALAKQEPPAGVLLTRSGPGELSISVPYSMKNSIVISRRQLIIGALVGVAAAVPSGLIFALIFLGFGASAVMTLLVSLASFLISLGPSLLIFGAITILVMAARQKHLGPVELKDGKIYPYIAGKSMPAVAAQEVQQLYTVQTKLMRKSPEAAPLTSLAVYALKKNGERIPLITPIYSAEIALYVEELFEAEMGIYDLPVYGDVAIPGQAGDAVPASPLPALQTEDLHCDGCGAGLTVTPEALRRGYVVCAHCAALTLLYEPGTSKPILGLPDPTSPAFRYRLQEQAGSLSIFERQGDRLVLSLDSQQKSLCINQPGNPFKMHTFSEISNPAVKVKPVLPEGDSAAGRIVDFVKNMGARMAYSGEVDPVQVMLESGGGGVFWIGVKTADGEEIPLVDGIRDFHEAFYLCKKIEAVLASQA